MKRLLFSAVFMLCLITLPVLADAAAGWQVMETEHFLIHFREPDRETAKDTAFIAEEVHKRIEKLFNSMVREKISLVIRGEETFANGYAMKILNTSIIVFPTFPGWTSIKSNSWLELLVIHEYAHALHMNMSAGQVAMMRKIFGEVPFYSQPAYIENSAWIEGLAVYIETQFTPGGRGKDAEYRMLVRLAQNDKAIENWDVLKKRDPYLWGYQMTRFIVEKYGEDKLMDIHRLVSSLTVESAEEAAEKILGEKWKDIESAFVGKMQVEAVRDIQAIKQQGLTSYHRIVPHGGFPVYDRRGQKIYYTTGRSLYSTDIQGENHKRLGSFHYQYSLSPNGNRVAFIEDGYECGKLVLSNIATGKKEYLLPPDGEKKKKKEPDKERDNRTFASDPAWSPDNKRIAFVMRHGLNSDLVYYDLKTKKTVHLVRGKYLENFFTPAWSPDGKTLVYGVWKYGGFHDLQMLELDKEGSEPVDITSNRTAEFNPHWTPDRKYILFDSDLNGVMNIYAYQVSTGKFFQVSRVLHGAYNPVVSPRGDEIAFMSYSKERLGIAVMPYRPETWVEVSFEKEQPPEPTRPPDYQSAKYNAFASAAPRFWVPANDYDRLGSTLGIGFAGMDNLQNLIYIGKATVGLNSGDITHEFNLWSKMLNLYTYKRDYAVAAGWENVENFIINIDGFYLRQETRKDWVFGTSTTRDYYGTGAFLDRKNYFAWEWAQDGEGSGFRFGTDFKYPNKLSDALIPLLTLPGQSQTEFSFNFLGNSMGDVYSLGGVRGEFPLHFMPAGEYRGRKLLRYHWGHETPMFRLSKQPLFSGLSLVFYLEGGKAWDDVDPGMQHGYGAALRWRSYYNQPQVEWGYAGDWDGRWKQSYVELSLSF